MRKKLVITIVLGLALLALAARPVLHLTGKERAGERKTGPMQQAIKMKTFTPNAMNPAIPQTIQGGLWRMDGGFQSVIMLRNALDATGITVSPVLYMADGTELDLTPVTLGPAGVAMVDINAAVASAPAALAGHISTFGSAAVKSTWSWQPVLAAVRSTDDVRGLIYQMHMEADANLIANPISAVTQQVLEGTWWKEEANVHGFLGLTNTSSAAITASVALGDNSGADVARKQYSLGPHATSWIDFASFWDQLPAADAGSVEVSFIGPMHAVVANGGMEDASNGYSHMLQFDVPESLILRERLAAMPAHVAASVPMPTTHWSANTTLDAAGIMVGSQEADMQFPSGTTFTPYLVLRNTTSDPMPVRLAANSMSGGAPLDVPLGALQLAALETRRINVGALLAASSLAGTNGYINLAATYSGTPTDLLEVSGSVDQSFNYVFEVPARPEAASGPSLINYWNTNGETDTMVTVYNFGGSAQDVIVTLAHRAGTYEMPIHLEPHASRSFTLGRMIRQGVPDRKGAVIPANIVQGSAKIGGATGSHSERTTVQIQVAVFNSRTATCSYTCNSCDYSVGACFDPEGISLSVGGSDNLFAYVIFGDGCEERWDADFGSYESYNSSIAQVDNSGAVTGMGAGNVALLATVTAPGGDGSCCTGGYCEGSATYEVSAYADVLPLILVQLDGSGSFSNITNVSKSVVEGEEVTLQVNSGETDSSGASWSLAGSTNAGWYPTTGATHAPSAASTSGSTITAYWVSTGNEVVQVTVARESASATINVSGPTGSALVSTTTGTWNINTSIHPGVTFLSAGGTLGNLGIEFSSSLPSQYQSGIKWVQIVTSWQTAGSGSQSFSCSATSISQLDNVYPYDYHTGTNDNPGVRLWSGNTSEYDGLTATMYLLWNSNLDGAIDVPLWSTAWSAYGDTTFSNGAWTTPGEDSYVTVNSSAATASYPTWTGTITNSSLCAPGGGSDLGSRIRGGSSALLFHPDQRVLQTSISQRAPLGKRAVLRERAGVTQ